MKPEFCKSSLHNNPFLLFYRLFLKVFSEISALDTNFLFNITVAVQFTVFFVWFMLYISSLPEHY